MHVSEVSLQILRRFHEIAYRFLFLLFARQFTDVGSAFYEPFETDIDRQEHDGPAGVVQKTAHGHRQHAAFCLQQPSRAAATAFDEVFDRHTADQIRGEILLENSCIEPVPLKTATQKERATAP